MLIVTVIVLLILAGVTIITMESDNNIIDRTVEVKDESNAVIEKDNNKIDEIENSITSK